jgi:hypothetical protein
MGFEPTTFSLATRSSTAELRPHGGSGGIRTHGTREGTLVFKTRSIDHSDTLPKFGTGNRDRTCDLTIIGRLLYQLSYTRT